MSMTLVGLAGLPSLFVLPGLRFPVALCMVLVGAARTAAATANLASLAGFGRANAVDRCKAGPALDFASDIAGFCAANDLSAPGKRSCFLSKKAPALRTVQTRRTRRDRAIAMHRVSPRPVDTPIPKGLLATLGDRAAEGHGPPGIARRHRAAAWDRRRTAGAQAELRRAVLLGLDARRGAARPGASAMTRLRRMPSRIPSQVPPGRCFD